MARDALEVEVQPGRIQLRGAITEDSELIRLVQTEMTELVLDLGEVSRINSFGVREWVLFLRRLRDAGCRVTLERCSVAVVNQLNLIANFAGGATIRSIYAPYYCDACSASRELLFELEGGVAAPDLAGSRACPQCGHPMEFEELVEAYLAFLR